MFCHVEPEQASRNSIFMWIIFCFWLSWSLLTSLIRLIVSLGFETTDCSLEELKPLALWLHDPVLWFPSVLFLSCLSSPHFLYYLLQPCRMVSVPPAPLLASQSSYSFSSFGAQLGHSIIGAALPVRPSLEPQFDLWAHRCWWWALILPLYVCLCVSLNRLWASWGQGSPYSTLYSWCLASKVL